MNTREFFDTHPATNIVEKAPLDHNPPILVMLGRDKDGNPLLSLSQIPEEKAFLSSQAIDVSCCSQQSFGFRYDLRLKEEKYRDIFYKVVDDLLNYAQNETDRKKYARCLIERYKVWSKFWKRDRTGLTKEEKQGLLGELIYIKDQLTRGKDSTILLRSWKGPECSPQDFIESGFWAEIKTIKHSSDSLSISSLEQLDNPAGLSDEDAQKVAGRLIVIKINLSPATPSPLKLTHLVDDIREMISSNSSALDLFENGLELLGFDYEKEKEDDFVAELVSITSFDANASDFPKYRARDVDNAVVGMTYQLSIPGLSKWIVEYN
jgi:hypothetical protein